MPNLSLFSILIYVFLNFFVFVLNFMRINPVSASIFVVVLSGCIVYSIFDYIRYTVSSFVTEYLFDTVSF